MAYLSNIPSDLYNDEWIALVNHILTHTSWSEVVDGSEMRCALGELEHPIEAKALQIFTVGRRVTKAAAELADLAAKALRFSKKTGIATHLLSLTEMGLVDLEQPGKILEHPDLFYNYRQ